MSVILKGLNTKKCVSGLNGNNLCDCDNTIKFLLFYEIG
jgi:hypothetical protein